MSEITKLANKTADIISRPVIAEKLFPEGANPRQMLFQRLAGKVGFSKKQALAIARLAEKKAAELTETAERIRKFYENDK